METASIWKSARGFCEAILYSPKNGAALKDGGISGAKVYFMEKQRLFEISRWKRDLNHINIILPEIGDDLRRAKP